MGENVKKWLGAAIAAFFAGWAFVGWVKERLVLDLVFFVAYAGIGLLLALLPHPGSVGRASEGTRSDARTLDGRKE
jgi:hypothetical protein